MNPEKPHKLAVLIDADNASASAVSGLFAEIAKYGIASVKRIYGDWSRPEPQGWKKDVLLKHALIPVQQFAYTKGKGLFTIQRTSPSPCGRGVGVRAAND